MQTTHQAGRPTQCHLLHPTMHAPVARLHADSGDLCWGRIYHVWHSMPIPKRSPRFSSTGRLINRQDPSPEGHLLHVTMCALVTRVHADGCLRCRPGWECSQGPAGTRADPSWSRPRRGFSLLQQDGCPTGGAGPQGIPSERALQGSCAAGSTGSALSVLEELRHFCLKKTCGQPG